MSNMSEVEGRGWGIARDTYHTLTPEAVRRGLGLGRPALDAGRLLVSREHHPDGLPRDGISTGAIHLREPRTSLRFLGGRLDNQHAEADQAVTEEDGGEEDDENQQHRELAVIDVLGDGERQVCGVGARESATRPQLCDM